MATIKFLKPGSKVIWAKETHGIITDVYDEYCDIDWENGKFPNQKRVPIKNLEDDLFVEIIN